MKNKLELRSDGINVYVTLFVNSHIVGKVILTIFILCVFSLLVYFSSTIPKNEISSFIFPLLIMGVLFIFFPLRYLFWNIYGKEYIIINTKSLSYNHDYGVFRTNLKTFTHNQLGTGFEPVRFSDDKEIGKMIFVNYNADTNLPENIFETSVLLDSESIKEIDLEISKLYETELNEDFNFQPFSQN